MYIRNLPFDYTTGKLKLNLNNDTFQMIINGKMNGLPQNYTSITMIKKDDDVTPYYISKSNNNELDYQNNKCNSFN
jgi:hypothetical protein